VVGAVVVVGAAVVVGAVVVVGAAVVVGAVVGTTGVDTSFPAHAMTSAARTLAARTECRVATRPFEPSSGRRTNPAEVLENHLLQPNLDSFAPDAD